MSRISNEIKKVEKELGKLYSEKAKEENRYAEITSKTTAKYNEEMQTLKNSYTSKMETLKKENQTKMARINDDIAFYGKNMIIIIFRFSGRIIYVISAIHNFGSRFFCFFN